LALVSAARESDLGSNDVTVEECSQLGYLMKSGDVALGYDMKDVQLVDDDAEDVRRAGKFPDVVFVRKLYGGVATGEANAAKKRMFQLQRLPIQKTDEEKEKGRGKKGLKKAADMEILDEEDFMQELEADREMRARVNVYKSEIAVSKETKQEGGDDDDKDDDQKITLDELLDNLVLDMKLDHVEPDAAMQLVGDTTIEEGMVFVGEGERAAKDKIGYVGREEAINIQSRETAIPVAGNVWGKDFLDEDL